MGVDCPSLGEFSVFAFKDDGWSLRLCFASERELYSRQTLCLQVLRSRPGSLRRRRSQPEKSCLPSCQGQACGARGGQVGIYVGYCCGAGRGFLGAGSQSPRSARGHGPGKARGEAAREMSLNRQPGGNDTLSPKHPVSRCRHAVLLLALNEP